RIRRRQENEGFAGRPGRRRQQGGGGPPLARKSGEGPAAIRPLAFGVAVPLFPPGLPALSRFGFPRDRVLSASPATAAPTSRPSPSASPSFAVRRTALPWSPACAGRHRRRAPCRGSAPLPDLRCTSPPSFGLSARTLGAAYAGTRTGSVPAVTDPVCRPSPALQGAIGETPLPRKAAWPQDGAMKRF